MKVILIEGASTAAGWFDYEKGGWAARLHLDVLPHNSANPADPTHIYNQAVPGRTLFSMTTDIERTLPYMAAFSSNTAVVLSAGFNEAKVAPNDDAPFVKPETFSATFLNVARLCAAHGAGLIAVGPQPIAVDRVVTSAGTVVKDTHLQMYNTIMRDESSAAGVPFVDVRELFSTMEQRVLDRDGAHPNSVGHAAIHAAVKQQLEQLKAL